MRNKVRKLKNKIKDSKGENILFKVHKHKVYNIKTIYSLWEYHKTINHSAQKKETDHILVKRRER